MTLSPEHFADFYQAVNGYKPFPWQRRLVEEVTAHGGRWPAVLDLPTSAGKTSALDAAVFLLALQVTEAGGELKPMPVDQRTAAVRTFFVVDRRIVVDEAAEKARRLAKLLNTADGRVDMAGRLQDVAREQRRVKRDDSAPLTPDDIAAIRRVAERLEAFGGGKALHVSVLRGGMYRDGSWADSPTQPTVCLSTVDQVGSRLLFRGYGVGPNMRAVHAGLVGNDALILVDEAHLSRPFIETLKAVEFYRSPAWAEKDHHVRTPFQVVVMSATAGDATASVGPMADEDERRPPKIGLSAEDRANATLAARLGASKRARLEEVKGGADDEDANRRAFAERLAGLARELANPPAPSKRPRSGETAPTAAPPAAVVGMVVNRVDTARRVYQQLLAGRDADRPEFDVILLTGRIRPYDRDRLLDEWFKYIEAKDGRPAPPNGKLFVVATQTVEVGANLSFDALVTEVAPLDALRQRFGRLDRLGSRKVSDAVIVARKDLLRDDDPVYGDRAKVTWDWLAKSAVGAGKSKRIDFGIDAFDALLPADLDERQRLLADLCAPPEHAPVMMPAHVDDLVQTTIPPVPDPDPALFLHGPQAGPADVSIVWRADLTHAQLTAASDTDRSDRESRETKVVGTVALVPPVSMEALPMPVWAVRKWLGGGPATDVTDTEGEDDPDASDRRQRPKPGRPFLRWRGPDADDGSEVDTEPRPGDTIVVPSSYGGCDAFGWNPESVAPVEDVADDCSWRAKRRPVLRVHPPSSVHRVALTAWSRLADPLPAGVADDLRSRLAVDPEVGEPDWRAAAKAFESVGGKYDWLKGKIRLVPYPDGDGVVLVARGRPSGWPYPDDATAEDTADNGLADDEGSSFLGVDGRVPLDDHCRGVCDWVERFADQLGLGTRRPILSRAALLHDVGKADPRFQEWLFGNPVDAARASGPIAKSGTDGRNAAAVEAARRRAGWPKHARHEAMSVLLVRDTPAATDGVSDPDLLMYLIGTHHGRGRPLWPVTLDDDLPGGSDIPPLVEGRLDGMQLRSEGRLRPEAELTPYHAGWVDAFWQMVTKYGYWGLAYLETLLVLADHRQSEAESEADG